MNSVQNYVVMNGTVDRINLAYILEVLNKKYYADMDHLISIIFGLGAPIDESDFPEKSFPAEDRHATFKEYNVLTDTVIYKYSLVCERWFANEEDLKKFMEGESYFGKDYAYKEDETHKFYGSRMYETEGVCTSAEWMKNAAE